MFCRRDILSLLKPSIKLLMTELNWQMYVTRHADFLSERMRQLKTGIYTVYWDDILDRVNATSKMLQDSQLDLYSVAAAVKSDRIFAEFKRDCFN